PKVEEYDNNLFIVIRMLELEESVLSLDQLSMFISSRFIVTFQATEADNLDPVRVRIRKERSRIRKAGPDYLAYSIIDTVIDSYFPALEGYEERIETLEDRILSGTQNAQLAEIHEIKRDLLVLRRNIWPVREALATLLRESYPAISEETRLYLRDCYDHAIRIIDLIENYRQIAADLMDLYLSMVSNRMNEIMKVLTVISTIFIPPTFVAGIYGMNFNTEVSPLNMPELNTYFGYPVCLAVMSLMTLSVIAFLFHKGWLGTR
ncbi:MAG: magnesium/cobalt transporter CorA, partial [Cyanobacteria bacterium]|nr:magnesium/cobalt transporter CorA [Cyanobacteriota bacterium]